MTAGFPHSLAHLGTVTLQRSAWPPVMCITTKPFSVSRIWVGISTSNSRIFFFLNPYLLDRTRLGSSCTSRSGVAFCKTRQGKKGCLDPVISSSTKLQLIATSPTPLGLHRMGEQYQLCSVPAQSLHSRADPSPWRAPAQGRQRRVSFPLVTRAVSISGLQSCNSAKLSCPTFKQTPFPPLPSSPGCSKPHTFSLK